MPDKAAAPAEQQQSTLPEKPIESLDVADFMSMSSSDLDKLMQSAKEVDKPAEQQQDPQPQPAATQEVNKQFPEKLTMPEKVNAPEEKPKTEAETLEDQVKAMFTKGADTDANQQQSTEAQPAPQEQKPEQMVEDPETGQKVPLSALIKQRQENAELKERLAKLEGYYEAASKGQPQQPTVQQETPEQVMQKLEGYRQKADDNYEQQSMKLAELYEEGEITFVEYRQRDKQLLNQTNNLKNQIDTRLRSIQEEASRPSPEALQNMVENNPYLKQATDQLIQQNPWINNLPDATFEVLREKALDNMRQMKLPVNESVESIWNMRQAMVQVGKNFGFDQAFAVSPTANQQEQGNPQPLPGQKVTAEQRADKLTLAKNHPPTTGITGFGNQQGDPSNNLRSGQGGSGGIEGMSPLEIAGSLPRETLERMAYGDFV